jgi:hypothetical protein
VEEILPVAGPDWVRVADVLARKMGTAARKGEYLRKKYVHNTPISVPGSGEILGTSHVLVAAA